MDDRIFYDSDKMRINRRLERTSSIKETSRSAYYSPAAIARRWSSREFTHSNNTESSSAYSTSGWSGSNSNLSRWSGSTSNLFSGGPFTSGHGWSSHVNMVRDDVRTRSTVTTSPLSSAYYGEKPYSNKAFFFFFFNLVRLLIRGLNHIYHLFL